MMGFSRHLLLASAFLGVALATSSQALAYPPLVVEPESEERAEELAQQGNALSRAGKLPEAIAAYTESIELNVDYAVAANLGNLELLLEKYRDAAEHLAFAVLLLPD